VNIPTQPADAGADAHRGREPIGPANIGLRTALQIAAGRLYPSRACSSQQQPILVIPEQTAPVHLELLRGELEALKRLLTGPGAALPPNVPVHVTHATSSGLAECTLGLPAESRRLPMGYIVARFFVARLRAPGWMADGIEPGGAARCGWTVCI